MGGNEEQERFSIESRWPGTAPGEERGNSPLARRVAAFSQQMFAAATLDELLKQAVEAAQELVGGAEQVSVTLQQGEGVFHTPARTHDSAYLLDSLQYLHREGPCVQATAGEGEGMVYSADLAQDPQWPTWAPAAMAHGARSVLSVGLFPGGEPPRLGSLNCYSTQLGGLSPDDTNTLVLIASHTTAAMLSQLHSTDT